jgi:hypothetical protein
MSILHFRRRISAAGCFAAIAILTNACGDAGGPIDPSRPVADSRPSLASANVTRNYFEVPIQLDDWLTGFACLDEAIFFHVNATLKISTRTSPSGVTTAAYFLQVDRPNSWLIYKGVIYHVAQGRQTGQDDVWHTVSGVGDLYIEAGVEPDFEVAETGERLRLNFSWHIAVSPDGTVRVNKVSGACPFVP